MAETDLGDFAAAVRAREARWRSAGVRSELRPAGDGEKTAGWVAVCRFGDLEAELSFHGDGLAELCFADLAVGAVFRSHYDVADPARLASCLDEIFDLLTEPLTETG